MLVLSRNLGEEIVIGRNIRIVVVGVKRNRIRLGICAPRSVRIDRKEIHELRSEEWSIDDRATFPKVQPEIFAEKVGGKSR